MLKRLLAHPQYRDLDIDSAAAADARARIVQAKSLLKQIYREWYTSIRDAVPEGDGAVVEIGAAGGFMRQVVPGILATDLVAGGELDAILDCQRLPFAAGSVKALAMTNVFHHIPDVERFLAECSRCLRPGGRLLLWEPWVSAWSRLIYRYLHREPFAPDAERWDFPAAGPLSGANEALAWMVFARDRELFARRYPDLVVSHLQPGMPVCYLASGGIAYRSFLPGCCYAGLRRAEKLLSRWDPALAMFAFIVVEKRGG